MITIQPGKRRREGIVEPPDLEGLQKPVKRRRKGVVKPPVYEELQLPQRHAVLVGSGGQKTEDGLFANASRGEKVAPNGEKEVNKDQTTEIARGSDSGEPSTPTESAAPTRDPPVEDAHKDKEAMEEKAGDEDKDKH